MIIPIILSLAVGVIAGLFSPQLPTDTIITVLLMLLLFLVGLEIGSKKKIIKGMKRYGLKIILVPLSVMAGSILFSGFAVIFGYNLFEAFAIGAGVGYYSLSAVILTQTIGAEIGVTAFLTNIIREVLTILLIPFFVRYLGGMAAVASGGATSMDTTLGVIKEYTNAEIALISVINGVILTILVPIMVTILSMAR
jgi:uncharacterized membrane protein YbjE (DUF340 family)